MAWVTKTNKFLLCGLISLFAAGTLLGFGEQARLQNYSVRVTNRQTPPVTRVRDRPSLRFKRARPAARPVGDKPTLLIQKCHSDVITATALSSDARLYLTGGRDRTTCLWDVETGLLLRQFFEPSNSGGELSLIMGVERRQEVQFIHISKDNRVVLTGISDTEEKPSGALWEVSTGKLIWHITGMPIAISEDWKYVLTIVEEDHPKIKYEKYEVAYLWDATTGRLMRRIRCPQDAIISAAISADNRYVLTASFEATDYMHTSVILWDANTGREVKHFGSNTGRVSKVSFSPNDQLVTVSYIGQTILQKRHTVLWNLASAQEVNHFEGEPLSFSPDSHYLLTSTSTESSESNTRIHLYDISSGAELWSVVGHSRAASAGGQYHLLTRDKHFFLASIPAPFSDKAQTPERELRTNNELVRFQAPYTISEDGQLIFSTGYPDRQKESDDIAHIWNSASGTEKRHIDDSSVEIQNAFFAGAAIVMEVGPIGRSFYSPEKRNTWLLWGGREGQGVQQFDSEGTSAKSDNTVEMNLNGKTVLIEETESNVRILEPASKSEIRKFEGKDAEFSPNGAFLITHGPQGAIYLWDVITGRRKQSITLNTPEKDVTNEVNSPLSMIFDPQPRSNVPSFVDFSPDSKLILIASTVWAEGGARWGQLQLWDAVTGRKLRDFESHDVMFGGRMGELTTVEFSPDSRLILTGEDYTGVARIWNCSTGQVKWVLGGHSDYINSALFSADGKYVLTSGGSFTGDNTARLWSVMTGKEIRRFVGHSGTVNVARFALDNRFILTASSDRTARLWSIKDGQEVCRATVFSDGTWVVVDRDGRFDTNKFDGITGLHWIFPDNPTTPISLDVFTRLYFTPRLLFRIINGQPLKEVVSAASLNRAQPIVKILEVKPEADNGDFVAVSVQILEGSQTVLREGKRVQQTSGAYDLRLFRDNQLVDQYSDAVNSGQAEITRNPETSEDWRASNRITLDQDTSSYLHTFHHVKLPHQSGVKQVRFTAYAFNEDRVKGPTATPYSYDISNQPLTKKRRAYIIAVGVDANQSAWNLDFAAKSATDMARTLRERLKNDYEIVDIELLSTFAPDSFRPNLTKATKQNLKAVLDLLAGREVTEASRNAIDPLGQLRAATPDDFVVLYICSHGYADPQGNFYIIPYNTGKPRGVSERVLNECLSTTDQSPRCMDARTFLTNSISTDDLTRWWKSVDAAEMIMILDSCHSGAISGREFRPGPLGDPGFGQLSYDKGMLILSATQPDNTAMASLQTGGRSLLSDSLIANSQEPKQSIVEWLKESEITVPKKYEQLYPAVKKLDAQFPLLLDFRR